jgi:hypothetical protein
VAWWRYYPSICRGGGGGREYVGILIYDIQCPGLNSNRVLSLDQPTRVSLACDSYLSSNVFWRERLVLPYILRRYEKLMAQSRQSNALCAVLGIVCVFINIRYAFALKSCILGYMASKPWESGGSGKRETDGKNELPINFLINLSHQLYEKVKNTRCRFTDSSHTGLTTPNSPLRLFCMLGNAV